MSGAWWCFNCHIPLLTPTCERCGSRAGKPIARDLVPVFADEMALLRDRLGFDCLPEEAEDFWLWSSGSNYYCDGRRVAVLRYHGLPTPTLEVVDSRPLTGRTEDERHGEGVPSLIFAANQSRLQAIASEALSFLRRTLQECRDHAVVVPFSGGKDSLAVSLLAQRAIPPADLLHVFSDTGLEAPDTLQFVEQFRELHPSIPLIRVAPSVDFFDACELLGPPSRIKRWCCSTQKAAPLGIAYGALSGGRGVLSLCGVRRSESVARRKHERLLRQTKIPEETMACPIIDWSDLEVWAFLLSEQQLFNRAYNRGFRRVGCIHCPYNSAWSEFLNSEYYPRHVERWNEVVTGYYNRAVATERIAVGDRWKVRAGGLLRSDDRAPLEVRPCDKEPSSFSVTSSKAMSTDFWEYLKPFGRVAMMYDDGMLAHAGVLTARGELLFDVQLSRPRNHVRVTLHSDKNRRLLRQRITRQLRKATACVACGVCQMTCATGAIVCNGHYLIDETKCVHCLRCVTEIAGGCIAAHATNVSGRR